MENININTKAEISKINFLTFAILFIYTAIEVK